VKSHRTARSVQGGRRPVKIIQAVTERRGRRGMRATRFAALGGSDISAAARFEASGGGTRDVVATGRVHAQALTAFDAL